MNNCISSLSQHNCSWPLCANTNRIHGETAVLSLEVGNRFQTYCMREWEWQMWWNMSLTALAKCKSVLHSFFSPDRNIFLYHSYTALVVQWLLRHSEALDTWKGLDSTVNKHAAPTVLFSMSAGKQEMLSIYVKLCFSFIFRAQLNSGASTHSVGVFCWEVWDVFALCKLQVSHAQRAPRMQSGHMLHFKIHPLMLPLKHPHMPETQLQVVWGRNVQTAEKQQVIDNYFPKHQYC